MRRLIFKCSLLLFVMISGDNVSGQSAALQDSVSQAAKLYNSGKYLEAVRSYQHVLDQGYESAVLYFNLGNAYYKAGNPTFAILNYERANKLSANDEDILYNLELARKQIVDNIVPLPEPGFLAWWKQLISKLSSDKWGVHSLIAFLVFLILFGLFLFSGTFRMKRMAFWFSILALFYSGVTFSFGAEMRKKVVSHNSAVITERIVRVKGSPSESGTELFIIHEGLTVQLTDKLGEWVEIRLPDGNKGWVKESMMLRI